MSSNSYACIIITPKSFHQIYLSPSEGPIYKQVEEYTGGHSVTVFTPDELEDKNVLIYSFTYACEHIDPLNPLATRIVKHYKGEDTMYGTVVITKPVYEDEENTLAPLNEILSILSQ